MSLYNAAIHFAANHLEPMYWCCKHKKTRNLFICNACKLFIVYWCNWQEFASKSVRQTLFRLSAHCLFTRTSSINYAVHVGNRSMFFFHERDHRKKEKKIHQHGPRPIPIICTFPTPYILFSPNL